MIFFMLASFKLLFMHNHSKHPLAEISFFVWRPYKSNAESIRSRKRDNYQNNPQNKKDASDSNEESSDERAVMPAK